MAHFRDAATFVPSSGNGAQCNIQDLLFELRKINCLACIIDEGSSQAKMMACHGEISICAETVCILVEDILVDIF